jgi:hypothetical protein
MSGAGVPLVTGVVGVFDLGALLQDAYRVQKVQVFCGILRDPALASPLNSIDTTLEKNFESAGRTFE